MPSKIITEGDAYIARLKRMLGDGVLSSSEASVLIHEAQSGRMSAVEAHYLAGFIDQHRDKFDEGAKQRLVEWVSSGEASRLAVLAAETGRAQPVRQPAITADALAHGVKYAAREGRVSIGGFKADDPIQGQVGDCYFISSMVAVANARPDLLDKAIVANDDGSYSVTFHARPVRGLPTVPVTVKVDATFPTRGAGLEFASARNPKELWPLLFEKAYAGWKGSYDAIHGGMAGNALEALTGGEPHFSVVSTAMNEDAMFKTLSLANAPGGCVVANSKPEDTGIDGLVADHAYAVLGTEAHGGKKYVKLRNPWGEKEPSGRLRRDDGIFLLPIADFMKGYSSVETMALGAAA